MRFYTMTVNFVDTERPQEVWTGITFWQYVGSRLGFWVDHTLVPNEDRELVAEYQRKDIATWTRELEVDTNAPPEAGAATST